MNGSDSDLPCFLWHGAGCARGLTMSQIVTVRIRSRAIVAGKGCRLGQGAGQMTLFDSWRFQSPGALI
jgi:hypothetical protein